ncbi:MAG: type II/IV secretion system protein [Phycisphaerales bacterium]|nr:type II/IV secretion system protein [Phycisphaerales bacterium]
MVELSQTIDPSQLKNRKLGRIFTKLGIVSREQVHAALESRSNDPSKSKMKIGELMMEMGLVNSDQLGVALAGQRGLQFKRLTGVVIPQETLRALTPEAANVMRVVPLEIDPAAKTITVAVGSHANFQAVDNLRMNMYPGYEITVVVSTPADIDEVIRREYSKKMDVGELFSEVNRSEAVKNLQGRGDSIDVASLEDVASDNAVVRLVTNMLAQAIANRASDIHLEPFEDEFKMRYRIDGVLYEMKSQAKEIAMAIVSRVKILAKLDIAERRLPQDGRISYQLAADKEPIDLRVAVLPTMYGESVVLRVLDRSAVQLELDRIGLREDELKTMRAIINKPNGIVLVTGPTGSGKTTTLYAALRELNQVDTKILTAEDPVEYDIHGMIQCQVNLDQELTFARLLRSFLRQDPDIILVGEIRDLETAQIAIQASLTGHLVFATLHTNDAPSSILRLLDLGVESFLLTATIEAIVAQRLVRRICMKCKEEFVPSEEHLMELNLRMADVQARTLYRGRGCDACTKSGYKGRMALFEIMLMDDELRELVMQQASTSVLQAESRKRGMRTLRESGLLALYEGQTTIDEVVRETISSGE